MGGAYRAVYLAQGGTQDLGLFSQVKMGLINPVYALCIEQRVINKGQETMFYEGHVADGSNAS